MRRWLFNFATALPLTFGVSLMGCAAHQTVAPMPDSSHPIVFRTDSPPEQLAAMPKDAAKAILIARAYWEVSPHVLRRGTGPFTYTLWREGGGWMVNIEAAAGTNGTEAYIGSDWKVSLTIGF